MSDVYAPAQSPSVKQVTSDVFLCGMVAGTDFRGRNWSGGRWDRVRQHEPAVSVFDSFPLAGRPWRAAVALGAGRGDGADRPAGAAGRTLRHQRVEGIAGSTRFARAAALCIALQLAELDLGLTRLSAHDRGTRVSAWNRLEVSCPARVFRTHVQQTAYATEFR